MRATSDVRRSTYDDQRGGRRQGTYMKQSTESMRALFCSRVAFWGWAHMWTFWLRRMFTIRCVLGAPENAFSEIRLDCIVKKSRNGNARVVDFPILVGQARSSRFAHHTRSVRTTTVYARLPAPGGLVAFSAFMVFRAFMVFSAFMVFRASPVSRSPINGSPVSRSPVTGPPPDPSGLISHHSV